MTTDATLVLVILATAFNGILAGASLDQSIKQLPSRHKIGPKAYSIYMQAADLDKAKIWYPTIGIGGALLTIMAAISVFSMGGETPYSMPVYVAAVLSVAHSIVTSKAASTNFQQRKVFDDENALVCVLNRFERLQMTRAGLQLATFGAMLVSLTVWISHLKI